MNAEEKETEKEGGPSRQRSGFSFGEKGRSGQSEVSDASTKKVDSEQCQQGEMETPKRERKEYVYFLESSDGTAVKIGFSTNIPLRIQALKPKHPGIKLIGTMPGGYHKEHALHRKFSEYRLSGEWFATAEPVRKFIAKWPVKKKSLDVDSAALHMLFDSSMLDRIENYRRELEKIPTRAEAIRQLLRLALAAEKKEEC